MKIVWTNYLKSRARQRGFELEIIENIVRYSAERYFDMATGRRVAIGQHNDRPVIIPYEADENSITPVTIHAATRQQVNFRIKTGRFTNE
jgi:hypothetical protein